MVVIININKVLLRESIMKGTREKNQNKQKNVENSRNKNKRRLQIKSENATFVGINSIFAVIFVTSIILSFLDRKYHWLCWDTNAIGVLSQIVTAIASFVASTIGIAITLQNEEWWGVPLRDFNKLRANLHYPIEVLIILAIVFSATNVAFYILHMIIASIGMAIIALVFCIYVTFCEVPIMLKKEKRLKNIVKIQLLKAWKSQKISQELKTVLKRLIIKENNLRTTYSMFKSDDEEFNEFLLFNLLEVQDDVVKALNKITSKQELDQMVQRLYENIHDLLFFKLDLFEILKNDGCKCEPYIISAILGLKSIAEYRNRVTSLIAKRLFYLKYNTFSEDKYAEEKVKFIISIILTIINMSITNGDFDFVKALQVEFSINQRDLNKESHETLLFALISMQFYFLCNDSQNVSPELKSNILEYLDYSDIINHIKVCSWKSLYSSFARFFKVNFKEFMQYFILTEHNWDVPIYFEAQWVKLNCEYAFRWYFIHVLNTLDVQKFDYSSICFDEEYKYYLKEFGRRHFDEQKNFIVTDDMKSILKFYGVNDQQTFRIFTVFPQNAMKLFNFINELKRTELFNNPSKNLKTNGEIANNYKNIVLNAIRREWGYDKNLPVASLPKISILLIEKNSYADNYEEVLGNVLALSLCNQLARNVHIINITNDKNFDQNIGSIIKANIKYISQSSTNIQYYIKSPTISDQFEKMCEKTQKFNSSILGEYAFVEDDGFGFNVEFEEVVVRDLTDDEMIKQMEKCKSADGQFVYDGTFLSRDEIMKLIKNKYAMLIISIRYAIKSGDKAIFKVNLYD